MASEHQRRRLLLAMAATATVLVAVVYEAAVRRPWGQRLDATALSGRHVLSKRAIHVAGELHRAISVASLVLLGGAVVLVAVARGRRRLAVGVAIIIAGSIITTEALKHLLPRPSLGVQDVIGHHPSYPSGHTTIAMALGVTAAMVAPRRHRAATALAGAAFASVIGVSMLVTASHRPSDMVGAAFVVTAWSAVVLAALLSRTPTRPIVRPAWVQASPWMALAGAILLWIAFVGVVVVFAIHYGRLETISVGRAFVAASSAIVGTIVSCVAALLLAVGDADVDRPAARFAESLVRA